MEKNLQKLLLWAWIHDLGKLVWRGWIEREWKEYDTAHSEILVEMFDNLKISDEWKDIAYIASLHHAKDFQKFKDNLPDNDNFLAWCIYMADNISAKERNEDNEKYLKNTTRNQALENIFSKFFVEKNETILSNIKNSYFDAKTIYKIDSSTNLNSKQKTDFQTLYQQFKKELNVFLNQNIKISENTLYQLDILLQKYFTFIPSDAYKNIPDVSLYDHSKTVVMFAHILYEKFKNEESKKRLYRAITDEIVSQIKVNLVWWDFPSIQKFISSWVLKNPAKTLRARSFLVQLLQEAVLQFVLDKLGLTRANVLISAWWKFVLLAPENINIDNLKSQINSYLIENYSWLKFVLEKKLVDLKDIVWFEEKEWDKKIIKISFQEKIVALFDKLSQAKFQSFDKENLEEIFAYKNPDWKVICKACGKRYVENEDENNALCDFCKTEIVLWEKLVKDIKNDWISFDYIDKNWKFDFDIGLKVWEENNILKWDLINKKFKILPNDWNFEKIEKWIVKSLNLYVPYKENDAVKSFEEILKDTNSNYIVMVKWDVDNMSLIFKHWFWESNYSLSRILTFSRLMELFFGYRLQRFLEENFKNVYTIYSGGDDFVFVVPFSDLKEFVWWKKDKYWKKIKNGLYDEFNYFVNNDKIHFSLGLWIFKDKTPIKHIFDSSEELLSVAKTQAKEKMNQNLNSEWEFRVLKYFGICGFEKENYVVLKNYLDTKNIFDLNWNFKDKTSVRYKLYEELKKMYYFIDKLQWADYVLSGWRILYMLSRNISDKEFIEEIKELIQSKDKDKIAEYLLKLAYEIYLNRK